MYIQIIIMALGRFFRNLDARTVKAKGKEKEMAAGRGREWARENWEYS